jgi:hypothetical protein
MQRMTISLVGSTQVILNEIALGITQDGLALTYALAIASEQRGVDQPDWRAINAAIVTKWRPSGLGRIKKRARAITKGKASPR